MSKITITDNKTHKLPSVRLSGISPHTFFKGTKKHLDVKGCDEERGYYVSLYSFEGGSCLNLKNGSISVGPINFEDYEELDVEMTFYPANK